MSEDVLVDRMPAEAVNYLISIFVVATLALATVKAWSNSILITPDVAFLVPFTLLIVIPTTIVGQNSISFIALTGLFAFLLCRLFGVTRNRPLRFRRYLPSGSAKHALYFLAIIHISIILASSFGVLLEHGISGAFQRDRLQQYFESGILTSTALNPLRIATELAFFIALGSMRVSGRRRLFWVVLLFYVFSLSVTANKRLSIVLPILAIVALIAREYRFRIKTILLVNVILLVSLPLYMYYTNLLRHGVELSGEETGIISTVVLSELDYNKYLDLSDSHVRAKGVEYGYGWFVGSIGNMIPRFAWRDKPVTSTSNRFTEIITGEPPSLHNPVMTFTIMGEGYFQIGLIGVILEVSLFLFLFSKLFWTLLRWESQIGSLAAFHIATMMLIYFRAELPFVQLAIAFLTVSLARSCVGRLGWTSAVIPVPAGMRLPSAEPRTLR